MNTSDFMDFAKTINGLAAIHGKPMDEGLIDGYWMALEDLSKQDFFEAAKKAAKTLKWFPKPSELRELVLDTKPADAAKLAWPEVMQLAKRSSGEHSDPIAAEAIRLMGGGRRLGQATEQDLEIWGKKEFCQLYETVSTKTAQDFPDVRQIEAESHAEISDGAAVDVRKTIDDLAARLGT